MIPDTAGHGPNMSANEVRKRLRLARNVIDLGGGSLLGSEPSKFTDDDVERSLERLLNRTAK